MTLALLAGCAGPSRTERPRTIQHVVLIELEDPSLASTLLAECRVQLADIPGVINYTAGTHLETGRDAVLGDYDVGLILGFASEADYQAYLDHPDHVALVEEWRPRWISIRIIDIHG